LFDKSDGAKKKFKNSRYKIMLKNAALIFFVCICFQLTSCAQNNEKPQTNQTKTSDTTVDQSKETEIPSGVKKRDYEPTPDKSILFLTLNAEGKVFYQDNLLDDASLKNILAEYNERHKNDPTTTGSKLPAYSVKDAKSFYVKADTRLSFSQIVKVLKVVKESSPTSYRAKFVVQPAEEVRGLAKTPNGRYVVSVDLGVCGKETDPLPRPNPLILFVRLDAAGKIILNTNPVERSEFPAFLQNIFKQREKNGAFVEGTNEIEKTIILSPAPDVKYGDVIKFIDELDEIGASQVILGGLCAGRSGMGDGGNGRTNSGQGQGEGSGVGSGSGAPPKVKKP
jgi:biopolymer transport protein ExbD